LTSASTTSGSTRFDKCRVGHVGEAAPAIGYLLVLGKNIGDQCKGSQIFLECLGERLRSRLARRRTRILHQVERRLDRKRFRPDFEAQAGDGLVEQPVPSRIRRHRLLVEELLDAILELIGLVLADILQPRPIMPERRLLHGGFELGIVDTIELEHEKQKMRGGGGDALLHVGVEFCARGVDGVAGMDEAGIRNEPTEKIVERFVTLYSLGERGARRSSVGEPGKLALICLFESNAFRVGPIEITLHLRIIDAGIEVGQIPFRQRAETGCRSRLDRTLRGAALGGRSRDKSNL